MISLTSPPNIVVEVGDLVVANFDNEFLLTYARAPEQLENPNGPKFHLYETALVLETINTNYSFYTLGLAKILLMEGQGWVPFRWLRKTNEDR